MTSVHRSQWRPLQVKFDFTENSRVHKRWGLACQNGLFSVKGSGFCTAQFGFNIYQNFLLMLGNFVL